MRLVIVGAGGVGGFFGGLVAAAGGDVVAVARGAHGAAIRARGLVVRTDGREIVARPGVVLEGEDLPPIRPGEAAAVLAVKHRDLPGALARIAPFVRPGAQVLSLLNGLGHEDDIRAAVPGARVLLGTAFVGAHVRGPGVVEHTSEGRIAFGPAAGDGPLRPEDEALRAALAAGGFPVKAVDDPRPILWRKLLWNCAFNPANALTGRRCADLVAVPAMRAHLRAVMDEVRAVAAAEGVDLPEAWIEKSLDAEVNRSSYHTSMRIDLEAGRPLEVEPIVSRPIRAAERHGVAVPRLRTVEALLLGIHP